MTVAKRWETCESRKESIAMEKIITPDNIRNFAYHNGEICKRPIRGIALSFFGLNGRAMYDEDTDEGIRYAEEGILFMVPYTHPWAWMNRQAVDYVDELLDVLFAKYGLSEDTPIVSTGKSMGGLASLVYMVYAKRTPAACVANCPVCDLPYHYTERPDLPRTLYSAFYHYPGTMEEAMRVTSPLHLVDQMPAAEYHVFHCEQDDKVNKQIHSDRFVEAMRTKHRITYDAVPERGHCDLTEEMQERFGQYVIGAVDRACAERGC